MTLLWAYAALALANVLGQLTEVGWLTTVTKPLLMPLLVAWLVTTAPRTRLTRLVLVALALSWLGDLALMGEGETWFLLGIGGFALAQTVYVVAFLAARDGFLRHRPALLAPYVLVWLGFVPFLATRVEGALLPAVVVYGALLVAMAALAVGVHRLTAVGAALFVVSDAILALTALADLTVPASGAIVMATYTAAQALIAHGVRHRAEADGGSARLAQITDPLGLPDRAGDGGRVDDLDTDADPDPGLDALT